MRDQMRKQVVDTEEAEVKSISGFNTKYLHTASASQLLPNSLLASKNRDFLISPTGSQVKISDLEDKVLAIYFSANWYPPCRDFTRVLTHAYDHLRTSDAAAFEVVFVSSDEDLEAFNNYFATMPWLAIPFSDLESRRALSQRFDIEAIPSFIILQPDGEKSTILDGVDVVYRYGTQAYPFTKDRLDELLQKDKDEHENQTLQGLLCNDHRDYLISHGSQKQVSVASLTGKTIGLYFSAKWCSPGEKFTPKLDSVYSKINNQEYLCSVDGSRDTGFEIVFVSSDHDRAAFEAYFQTMQWLAIPYDDRNIKDLARHFDVRGIPCLVILGPNGKTVTRNGRRLVNLYKERAYPYTDQRIKQLEEEANEEARNLPTRRLHSGHCHELTLVSEGQLGGGAFICCECDEQGGGWAYQCIGCGYELHPKCVR